MSTWPKHGDRVWVTEVSGVTFRDGSPVSEENPMLGTITVVYDKSSVQYDFCRFMPDEPELTCNGNGNTAEDFGDVGWFVREDACKPYNLLIEEEPEATDLTNKPEGKTDGRPIR